ncbi:MAG: hypothetical protein HY254_03230 [Burkholderiales bacterium]|nr:hypothetical protein [Burkholderiales bacterium]
MEQKAFSQAFHPRKTLFLGGNSTGKSTIIKSLFRAFDADPTGDLRGWDYDAIITVDFSVGDVEYTTLRRGDLKALFRGTRLVGVTTSSARWNEIFSSVVGFQLQLMDREDNVRVASPSMFFLPFYVNQDGSFFGNWDTFKNTKQFDSNSILHTLEYFAQVRPFKYFALKGEEKTVKSRISELEVDVSTLQRTRLRLRRSIKASPVKLTTTGFEKEVQELVKLANELGTKQDSVRSEIVEGQELARQLIDQIRLSEAALREHEADFKSVGQATEDQGVFRCPTCHAEHDASFHTFLELAEDARELYRLKERLQQNLESVAGRLARYRRESATLRHQYLDVSNVLNVKKGRLTFQDVVKSQGIDAAENVLDLEIASIQKLIVTATELALDLKIKIEALMKNHDITAPLTTFRNTFKELLVIADVVEFPNVDKWKLNKRPTDSGSPGPRSVVAYYGALWSAMRGSDSSLPSPVVIDSPNQNAQDKKHLERVMGILASKTPENAQVILCAEDPSEVFKPDLTVDLLRERALLETSQFEGIAYRVIPLAEQAIAELARIQE